MSGSIVITMGAPAGKFDVPVIIGVVSVVRLLESIVSVGGVAAVGSVVLNACVAIASALPLPVLVPVATLLATLIVISPLELAVGVTTRVYVVPLPENVPLVPLVTEMSPLVKPVTASLKVNVNVTSLAAVPGTLSVIVTIGVNKDKVGSSMSYTDMLLLVSVTDALTVN